MRIAICGGIAPQVISKQENDIGLIVWRRTGSKRCPNQEKEKKYSKSKKPQMMRKITNALLNMVA